MQGLIALLSNSAFMLALHVILGAMLGAALAAHIEGVFNHQELRYAALCFQTLQAQVSQHTQSIIDVQISPRHTHVKLCCCPLLPTAASFCLITLMSRQSVELNTQHLVHDTLLGTRPSL